MYMHQIARLESGQHPEDVAGAMGVSVRTVGSGLA